MGFVFSPIDVSAILAGLEPRAMLPSASLLVPLAIILPTAPAAMPALQEACATFVFSVPTLLVEGML